MTLVKVCGIRTKEAALKAAESGASLIGLIFAKSKRQVSLEQVAEIVQAVSERFPTSGAASSLPTRDAYFQSFPDMTGPQWFEKWAQLLQVAVADRPLVVGVFSNQGVEEINRVVAAVQLDLVQLHGDEPTGDADQIAVPVIRAIHVGEGDSEETVRQQIAPDHYAFILLDSKVSGASQQGGSGISFDWNVAHSLRQAFPFLVAGGLNPENVAEAIKKIGPWGVDVSSGVEVDGQKDLTKVELFVKRGREAKYSEG